MDQKTVRRLERELEKAIADVIVVHNVKREYPLRPSRQTMHLMAKAAVTVYEAAMEAHDRRDHDDDEEQK